MKHPEIRTDTFLSVDELYDLTGYRSPKKQAEQCRKQGIPFYINARGRPIIARAHIYGIKPPEPPKEDTWEPAVLNH